MQFPQISFASEKKKSLQLWHGSFGGTETPIRVEHRSLIPRDEVGYTAAQMSEIQTSKREQTTQKRHTENSKACWKTPLIKVFFLFFRIHVCTLGL